ncbi:ferritin-like domain-containing protein [Rhizobium lemnae]|uniref:Ferritin-like domain-containing protein n=1 Tax=Rhizobium lemnae TaxID=1214924 RepID=A0ABV8EFY8_9HYPH|nr:ferritin-like domain-containing protein [Rhizobium lemnae]MCJ8508912.1 ferritin-like domain-containing protein [Rhizobium lemnae]
MTHARDHFAVWLRDAHAMEVQCATMLRSQIGRIENYPDLRERLQEHLGETEGQAQSLRELMERAPSPQSVLKDVASKLSATAQGLTGLLASDEIVRICTSIYSFEHTEIATYRVLFAAADEIGDGKAVDVLGKIIEQEKAMADWIESYLDGVTRLYLMREERDLIAKR